MYKLQNKAAYSSAAQACNPSKPSQRQLEITKPADTRFGLDLCRVNGRVYILKVHGPDARQPDPFAPVSYAAHRVGLNRFDEITQIEEDYFRNTSLEKIYRYLHSSAYVNITVTERPVVSTSIVSSSKITEECFSPLDRSDRCSVSLVVPGTPAASVLPANSSIVEIDGTLTIGMKPHEIMAIYKYARHKSANKAVEVSTIPGDLARGFLMAYVMTSEVYRKDWRPTEHLRKSIRFSQRPKFRLSIATQTDSKGIGRTASLPEKKSTPLRSLSTLFRSSSVHT